MKVAGKDYRTIWINEGGCVWIIDQTQLPHEFTTVQLVNLSSACDAISNMLVRGAPLIGVTAAHGFFLAMQADTSNAGLQQAAEQLIATRPTAINLKWAVDRVYAALSNEAPENRLKSAKNLAVQLADEDVELCAAMGRNGLERIREMYTANNKTINVLTHCNAGWLATIDWGTALAPIYMAHNEGIPLHVWVDETRPRNQGAHLTAWELGEHGVDHTLIVDNAGGHLMQQGLVDMVIVGTDRTTANGDVCNKIGTYLKALAAYDNKVPFWVAAPSPSIDWALHDGREIPIEQRSGLEVAQVYGRDATGRANRVMISPPETRCSNYAFDVTPARLVTGLITERGCCAPGDLRSLFPDEYKKQTHND